MKEKQNKTQPIEKTQTLFKSDFKPICYKGC